MSNYITTFNAQGHSIFTPKIPTQQNPLPIPMGEITYLYTTRAPTASLSLSTDSDIDTYAQDRVHGLPPSAPVPLGGSTAAIISLAPGATTPNRRTITLGVFGVMRGVVRLTLVDSGEERVLKEGDGVVLRGALHTWRNETDGNEGGWAKLMVFAQSVREFEVAGRKVEAEWL